MTERLDMILAKDGEGEFRLWACRGAGKGCARNEFRRQRKPCTDCVGPLDEKLTLAEVTDLLKRGDA
ncbi:hypothetical protein JQ594_15650 [Bradyrhizobium manausense]|uniref:hypothetical protein n=1 Tax=Bradyrhizobium manausense TaxID=989370 RepID=UPI001BA4663F|nr:hypothetical protein [Bradyrhizobium manausense]MBR0687366.1 hypothetical protein [Bradyrhizobium manausense]